MEKNVAYLGLDVHKESIVYALFVGSETKPRVQEKACPDSKSFYRKIVQWHEEYVLTVYYEASGCGYWLYRNLLAMGVNCRVVAPSSIPKDSRGFKYDRLDARDLAVYGRAGRLCFVRVPDASSEADRDLIRLRETMVKNNTRTIQRISALLLRANHSCPHRSNSPRYVGWLRRVALSDKSRVVLEHYIDLLEYQRAKVQQIEDEISQLAQTDKYREPCKILQAFSGIRETIAMNLLTNIVDFRAFAKPQQLFCWVGVVSAKHASAGRDRALGITKKGNSLVRRSLILAAQKYSSSKKKSKALVKRQQEVKTEYVNIADRATRRLRKRYWHLQQKGKASNKIKVALARELLGFIWEAMIRYHTGEILPEQTK